MTTTTLLNFDDVLSKYDQLLWNLTNKLRYNPCIAQNTDIEDIHTVVLHAAWRAMIDYNKKPTRYKYSTFLTWHIRVSLSNHYKELLKEFYHATDIDPTTIDFSVPDPLLKLEQQETVNKILSNIDEITSNVLKMKYLEGYTLEECGQKYDLLPNAVGYLIGKVKKRYAQ